MAEQYIHYKGLKENQTSWFRNNQGQLVSVFPGTRVLLDPLLHTEIQPALQAGVAIIEHDQPPGFDYLHEASSPLDTSPKYEKYFRSAHARSRSRGLPEIKSLAVEDLGKAVRCFLPWPSWREELEGFLSFSESRAFEQGTPSRVSLPPLFHLNLIILHRIGELIATHFFAEVEEAIDRKTLNCWEYGQYNCTKGELRKNIKRSVRMPTRRQALGEVLQIWGAWRGPKGPSSRTLRKYRSALGPDCAVRSFADQQILDVLREPSQRIIFGPGIVEVGQYVPGRAASPALTIVGPSLGCITYLIKPSFEQRLIEAGTDLGACGIRPRPYRISI